MAFELPPLVDLLAAEFQQMTTVVPGVPGMRVLIASGVLVDRIAIYVREHGPDAVEGLLLDLDLRVE
jgi:hypothetical protein